MKVWITRPDSAEYHAGGLRSVRVWVDEPVFDQRAVIKAFDLYDPVAKRYGPEVYREAGWVSKSGSCKAKHFLRQDERVLMLVQHKIYESLIPHWKRFLLELDLKAETVTLVKPSVFLRDGDPAGDHPITVETGTASLFEDGDLARPYHRESYPGFEHKLDGVL
jgi:hypothetical protein